MRLRDSTLLLTPTDIANHLACRHLTQLDRARLAGERIELRQDPRIDALRHRGETHEKGFVDSLAAEGLSITDLRGHDDPAATLDAMTAGADVMASRVAAGSSWPRRSVIDRPSAASESTNPFSWVSPRWRRASMRGSWRSSIRSPARRARSSWVRWRQARWFAMSVGVRRRVE